VRFKTPHTGVTHWTDGIKGPIAFDNRELDDLVIMRADGVPTYNFAVVVDDLTMGVTVVIRGDDHIPNTPRQIVIYEALAAPLPQFAHMPLMLAKDRGKLSKRRGAKAVLEYRNQGYLTQALNNYLARLGWSHGDQEIFSEDELIRFFTLEHATKSAGVYDEDKLLWLNGHYIKETPDADLARLLTPFLAPLGIADPDAAYLTRGAGTLKARCRTLVEMADAARFYFQAPERYDEKGAEKFLGPAAAPLLKEITARLEALASYSEEALNHLFQDLAAVTGAKMVNLAQPVRLALTGRTASPGLYEIISIIGKEETLARLQRALAFTQAVA
jgi:glutamyl-tRNA synthetase